jgi:hypothetical protein
MITIININEIIKKSFLSMKMLKMQFNIKLKWSLHVKKNSWKNDNANVRVHTSHYIDVKNLL